MLYISTPYINPEPKALNLKDLNPKPIVYSII